MERLYKSAKCASPASGVSLKYLTIYVKKYLQWFSFTWKFDWPQYTPAHSFSLEWPTSPSVQSPALLAPSPWTAWSASHILTEGSTWTRSSSLHWLLMPCSNTGGALWVCPNKKRIVLSSQIMLDLNETDSINSHGLIWWMMVSLLSLSWLKENMFHL